MADIIDLYPIPLFDAALPTLATLPLAQKQSLIRDALTAIHSYVGWESCSLLEERRKEQLDGLGGPTIYVTGGPICTVHRMWFDNGRTFNEDEPKAGDLDNIVDPSSYRVHQNQWAVIRTRSAEAYLNSGFGYGMSFASGYAGFRYFGDRNPGATGRLQQGRYGWPEGTGVVWIDYTCGYNALSIPQAVLTACKELISYSYRVSGNGGIVETSTTYQDTSIGASVLASAFSTDGSLMNARNILGRAGLIRPWSAATPRFG